MNTVITPEIASWHHYFVEAVVNEVEAAHSISDLFGMGEDHWVMEVYDTSVMLANAVDAAYKLGQQDFPGVPMYELPLKFAKRYLHLCEVDEYQNVNHPVMAAEALKITADWLIEGSKAFKNESKQTTK